jgi:hypothetical protein
LFFLEPLLCFFVVSAESSAADVRLADGVLLHLRRFLECEFDAFATVFEPKQAI